MEIEIYIKDGFKPVVRELPVTQVFHLPTFIKYEGSIYMRETNSTGYFPIYAKDVT